MQTPQTGKSLANLKDNLYKTDFAAWTQQQSYLLRNQQWHQLDLPNLIEEIESLGRLERQELRHRLSILIANLLKWEFKSTQRSRNWLVTIRLQRREILKLLSENSRLKPDLEKILPEAYENARDLASSETNLPLSTFPQQCLYTLLEVMSDRFYPSEAANDDLMESSPKT